MGETRFWGDQGYTGQSEVIHARAGRAKDFTNRRYRGHGRLKPVEKAKNGTKHCIDLRSQSHWPICLRFEGNCSMRREHVGETHRTRACEAVNEDVSAETRAGASVGRNPTAFSAFTTSSSDVPWLMLRLKHLFSSRIRRVRVEYPIFHRGCRATG
jgi:hypothetical protein